jgi:WD40 repeat protein
MKKVILLMAVILSIIACASQEKATAPESAAPRYPVAQNGEQVVTVQDAAPEIVTPLPVAAQDTEPSTGRGLEVEALPDAQGEIAVFPQVGHSSSVSSVAFSPDGKTIVSGSNDMMVKLWDTATGREIRTFGDSSYVSSVAFSSDGTIVVSGFVNTGITLWDVATGSEIRNFGRSSGIDRVAFSPDGKQIVSNFMDKTVKLWDATTGREIRTFSGHSKEVLAVAFSPDGETIVSGSDDGPLKLWDVVTGQEIRTLFGHGSWVWSP